MAVHVDIFAELNRNSIDRSADEIQRDLERRGEKAGQGYTSGFAKAVESDSKVRAAADKVANNLDKVITAEAKRATQLEKSKAVNEAVAASEAKLNQQRANGFTEAAKSTEADLVKLREKQVEVNNKLVASTAAVSKAERDRAAAVREAGDAYKKMGDDAESVLTRLGNFGDRHGGGAIPLNIGLTGLGLLPAAATAITEVAGAVQQLAGAGLALPGIFAGLASSVGVGALGLHGMSDAIKAVDKASDGTKTSVDAANKALAGLSPTGADVVKTVVGLKGTFSDLRNIASENLFAGVSDGLKGLVEADLPAATRGIDGISRGLNQNIKQTLTSLGSGSSQGILDRILGNTADAQSRLTAAIDPAIHAIGTLTAAGTDSLPRLADAVGKVASRFDAFISAADGDGRLKKWIDEGLDGFTSLGKTVLNIGKSFTAITEAVGGGAGLLESLREATSKMALFLNSTEGQNKLRDFFQQGRDTLSELKDVATSAGPILAGVFNAGISAANLWLPVIGKVLDVINSIPGGAQTAVTAFVAWKTIAGVTSLISSLEKISTLLKVTLPADAVVSGAGIAAGLGKALPIIGQILAAYELGKTNPALNTPTGQSFPDGSRNVLGPDGNLVVLDKDGKPFRGLLAGDGPGPAIPNGSLPPSAIAGTHSLGPADPTGGLLLPPGLTATPPPSGAPTPTIFGVPFSAGTPSGGGVGSSLTTPGVSSYTAPTVLAGDGKTPFVDPSKYQLGDPLAGAPAAVAGTDPQKVFEADSAVITQTHNLEQKKLALQVLEAQGNATQQQLLTARNDLQEQERALADAQAKDVEARMAQTKKASASLGEFGASLDQDLGISKGLAGIADNLVRFLGNLALAPELAKLNAISAASPSQSGFGAIGIAGASGAFGPQYTGLSAQSGFGQTAFSRQVGAPNASGVYPGDAALLANVPPGRYSQTGNADLTKGLGDCSSAIEDLVNIIDGQPTAGRSLSTGNEAEWLAARGFLPGSGGPGDFRVGFNSGHTQATLPGGTPFNYGSDSAAARGGVGGTGADDPAFTSHYYRPFGVPAPSAIGPTPLGGGSGPDLYSPANTDPGLNNPAAAPGGAGPLPTLPSGFGGQGYGGFGGPTGAPGVGPTQIGAAVEPAGGTGKGGIGITPGGSVDTALNLASTALPGVGQAAATGAKLASRGIQFVGQAAGIGVQGLLDTFLPTGGSDLANHSWFSKIIGGIAGAAPALPNTAGKPAAPQPQQQGQQGGQGQGGGNTNITVNNQRATEDGVGRDIAHAMQNQYLPAGMP